MNDSFVFFRSFRTIDMFGRFSAPGPPQIAPGGQYYVDFLTASVDPLEPRRAKTAWFISNFHRTKKCPVLGLLKTYSIFNKTVSLLEAF